MKQQYENTYTFIRTSWCLPIWFPIHESDVSYIYNCMILCITYFYVSYVYLIYVLLIYTSSYWLSYYICLIECSYI